MFSEQKCFHNEISRMRFCRGCGTKSLRGVALMTVLAVLTVAPAPFACPTKYSTKRQPWRFWRFSRLWRFWSWRLQPLNSTPLFRHPDKNSFSMSFFLAVQKLTPPPQKRYIHLKIPGPGHLRPVKIKLVGRSNQVRRKCGKCGRSLSPRQIRVWGNSTDQKCRKCGKCGHKNAENAADWR